MTKIDWKNKGTMHKIFDQKKKDEKVKNRESDQIATLYLSTKKKEVRQTATVWSNHGPNFRDHHDKMKEMVLESI